MARHADATVRGRRRGLIVIGLTTALVVAAAGGTVTWLRRNPAPATAQLACAPVKVSIAASPEIAPIVTAAVGRVGSDRCRSYAVRSVKSNTLVTELDRGITPDVWVPDSSTWLGAVAASAGGPWTAGGSIATSPIALAAPASGTGSLAAVPASWTAYINGAGNLDMANPDVDTVSRLAYFASRVGEPEDLPPSVASRLIFISRFAAASTDDLFTKVLHGTSTAPFPASQQSITAFNASASGTRLKASFPTSGTAVLDYPWSPRPGLDATTQAAVDAALRELRSPATVTALTDAGFLPAREGADTSGPTRLEMIDASRQEVAMAQWDVLRTDMRMLAVIDVSGSMKYPGPGTAGLARVEVTKEAATSALKILPAGSQIGAWIFSTRLGPNNRDWRWLTPIARLDTTANGVTHRQQLINDTAKLPTLVHGDTGLYDTTLAAYLHMRDTYDGHYVNSVVVMTDGKNDDTDGGISLAQLLARLAAERDPARPVRVITIGMGEADPKALTKIAAATGGTSYIADSADDLRRVFVAALLARTKSIPTPS